MPRGVLSSRGDVPFAPLQTQTEGLSTQPGLAGGPELRGPSSRPPLNGCRARSPQPGPTGDGYSTAGHVARSCCCPEPPPSGRSLRNPRCGDGDAVPAQGEGQRPSHSRLPCLVLHGYVEKILAKTSTCHLGDIRAVSAGALPAGGGWAGQTACATAAGPGWALHTHTVHTIAGRPRRRWPSVIVTPLQRRTGLSWPVISDAWQGRPLPHSAPF